MSVERTSVSPHKNNKNDIEKIVSRDLCSRGCGLAVAAVGRAIPVGPLKAEVLVGESGPVDGGDELTAEVEQEVERVASLPSYQPTKSEYAEHCVTHSPYRPWCKHCAEGRGQEFGHYRRREGDPNRVPMVAFDYAGVRDNGEFVSYLEMKESDDESVARVLVVALRTPDDRQSCVFGHVVPCKGIDENKFAVDCLVADILWTGYTRVTLKSDNEPAILKLLIESLRELRINGLEQVMSENSPEYDPQSNGMAEAAVKSWKGMFRTHKSALEEQLGAKIPVKHPMISWLAKWASDILVWTVKGLDGITAYQRVRGKPFRTRLPAMGEIVRFKLRPKEPTANSSDGKRFHNGVFLGIDRRTGQYILHSDEGIKHARTILRVPDAEKWYPSVVQ